jgi:branched-chain amino acid transport system substrate-binding protein
MRLMSSLRGGSPKWRAHQTRLRAANRAKFFKERYLALGGRIADEQFFKSGQQDFSDPIQKLKNLSPQPDAVFISGNPEDAVPTVQQLRNAGIQLPILSGDGFDIDLLTLLPKQENGNGVYFATHAYLQSKRPEVVSFVKAYREEYGKAPENSLPSVIIDKCPHSLHFFFILLTTCIFDISLV